MDDDKMMNLKSLAIRFIILALVIASSMCQGAIIRSETFTTDFTNSKEARKKAIWFPADKLNITKQGLGWKGDGSSSYDGWIQTKPVAVGLSWRPPAAIGIRVTTLPPPKSIVLNDGSKSIPYPGNVFVRYSPDLKHWSSWIILDNVYRKSSDKKKRNERYYEGQISVTQRNRNEYYKLLDNYSKLNVPWKSDEEAAVRWILKQQPKFFSKNIPFIGYIEFLFESNFYGGQRIKSFKADVSYCMNGRHYPPPQNSTYNKRSAIPWRFKAKQAMLTPKISMPLSGNKTTFSFSVKNNGSNAVDIYGPFANLTRLIVIDPNGKKHEAFNWKEGINLTEKLLPRKEIAWNDDISRRIEFKGKGEYKISFTVNGIESNQIIVVKD